MMTKFLDKLVMDGVVLRVGDILTFKQYNSTSKITHIRSEKSKCGTIYLTVIYENGGWDSTILIEEYIKSGKIVHKKACATPLESNDCKTCCVGSDQKYKEYELQIATLKSEINALNNELVKIATKAMEVAGFKRKVD